MPPPHQPRFHLEPKTVDEYLHNFKVALDDYYGTEDPGRVEEYHILGVFVVPVNVRKLIIYVAHEDPSTARKVSRIYYTLPVDTDDASFFVGGRPRVVASEGPYINAFDVPAQFATAPEFISAIIAEIGRGPPEGRLTPWEDEIEKQRVIMTSGGSFFAVRTATRHHKFMTEMLPKVMPILRETIVRRPANAPAVGAVVVPAVGAPAVGVPAVGAPAVRHRTSSNPPVTPGRSSTGTRRRRSEERRRRRTRTKSNSDPARLTPPNIFNMVPVMTRRTRRRTNIFNLPNISNTDPTAVKRRRRSRPNLDPKD